MHAAAYGCCICVCGKFHAPTCRFLAVLSSIVKHARKSECCHCQCKSENKECFFFIGWAFAKKKKQSNMHGPLCHDLHLPLSIHFWLIQNMRQYSYSCCACKHLVLLRIWTLIGVRCAVVLIVKARAAHFAGLQ